MTQSEESGMLVPRRSHRGKWALGLVFLFLAGVGAFIYSQGIEGRRWSPSSDCREQLKLLGIALHNYHTAQGCFPPAEVLDAAGRPAHNWLALLLPYLEGVGDRSYSFAEPWDAAPNTRVAGHLDWLHCPHCQSPADEANYVIVSGPGFIFDRLAVPAQTADVKDGLQNTIMLVEVCGSGIRLTEPRTMSWEDFIARFGARSVGPHEGGFNVLFADSSVHFLPYDVQPEQLHALFTRAGGEKVD